MREVYYIGKKDLNAMGLFAGGDSAQYLEGYQFLFYVQRCQKHYVVT